MAHPSDSSRSVAPPCYLAAVHHPSRLWRRLAVGGRESDVSGKVKPVRGYLRPRLKLPNTDSSLHWPSSVRAVDSHHFVYDELGLNRRLEAELCHVPNERLGSRLH